MKTHFLYKYSLFFSLVLLNGILYAQKIPFLPSASPKGISLVINHKPLHPQTKVEGGFIGFNIYRADAGEEDFKKLNKKPLSAVATPQELREKVGVKRFQKLQKAFQGDEQRIFDELMTGDTAFVFLSLMDLQYAETFGLVFYDENIKKGKSYQYYVTKVKEDGTESEKSEIKQATEGKPLVNLPKPTGIKLMSSGNRVTVYFDKSKDGFFKNVYRSEDSTGGYVKINKLPLMTNPSGSQKQDFYVDSTAQIGKTYYYSVASIDLFENQVFSDTLKMLIKSAYPIPAPDSLRLSNENAGTRISWRIKRAENLAGIQVLRRVVVDNTENLLMEKDTQFEVINPIFLPPTDTVFIDQNAQSGKNYRYMIRAVAKDLATTSVSLGFSHLYNNMQAPLPVTKVEAEPLLKAIRLTWQPNTDANVGGYMVFRTYGATTAPEAISEILGRETGVFVDSSKALSKKNTYAYYIKTFAHSGKESPFTKPVFASPLEPHHQAHRMNSLEGKNNEFLGNQLKWGLPQDHETQKVRVFRAKATDTLTWEMIYEERIAEGLYSFRDSVPFAEGTYYKMCAVSFDNKQSAFSDLLLLQSKTVSVMPPNEIFVEKTENSLKIKWLPVVDAQLKNYVIYRRTLKGGIQKIGEATKGTHFFEDKNLAEESYYYFVTCANLDGSEGKPSQEVAYRLIKN